MILPPYSQHTTPARDATVEHIKHSKEYVRGLVDVDQVRLVVFTPSSEADVVRKAMNDAGATNQINKDEDASSFSTTGLACCRQIQDEPNILAQEEEIRLESVFKTSLLGNVLLNVRKVHPYQEMGFDIYPYSSYKLMEFTEQARTTEDLTISKQVKLFVFVSSLYANKIRMALGDAGAGVIGDYTHCSFSVKKIMGKTSKQEKERIETVVDANLLGKVILKIKEICPAEKIKFDTSHLFQISDALKTQLSEIKRSRYY